MEVSFAELERDPVHTLRGIYSFFGWPGFDALERRTAAYVTSLAGFRKNQHAQVTREDARKVVRQWREAFEAFGYPFPDQQF